MTLAEHHAQRILSTSGLLVARRVGVSVAAAVATAVLARTMSVGQGMLASAVHARCGGSGVIRVKIAGSIRQESRPSGSGLSIHSRRVAKFAADARA